MQISSGQECSHPAACIRGTLLASLEASQMITLNGPQCWGPRLLTSRAHSRLSSTKLLAIPSSALHVFSLGRRSPAGKRSGRGFLESQAPMSDRWSRAHIWLVQGPYLVSDLILGSFSFFLQIRLSCQSCLEKSPTGFIRCFF